MKNILTILTILLLISGCQTATKKIIEGDLYFKLIDPQRFFDAPDSTLTKIEISIRTANKDRMNMQDREIYDVLQFMSDKRLLRKPFIRLRKDNGEVFMVFLDSADYAKVKDYKHNDLVRDNKRIRVKVEVNKIKHDSLTVYEAVKLISLDKLDGKTYWKK
jgi:hypothetical protein